MGSWDYCQIGFLCIRKNKKQVKKLLECMGVDFSVVYDSEAGQINSKFYEAKMGCGHSTLEPSEIYTIVNKIFENTTILYESENGNNTGDYYSRYEKVYDPETKKVFIGEKNYCYDGDEVFGESVYEIIKEECEEAAKKRDIPIVWGEYYPEGEEFYDLCQEILEEHGGISGFGTKEITEDIPAVEVNKETVISLIDCAAKRGYNDLVKDITKAFDIEYVSPYYDDSKEEEG